MVKDINGPGAANSNPSYLLVANGALYFAAQDATHGVELWRSDGTGSGTQMVADTTPGGSFFPQDLTVAFGGLYMWGTDAANDTELYLYPGI